MYVFVSTYVHMCVCTCMCIHRYVLCSMLVHAAVCVWGTICTCCMWMCVGATDAACWSHQNIPLLQLGLLLPVPQAKLCVASSPAAPYHYFPSGLAPGQGQEVAASSVG